MTSYIEAITILSPNGDRKAAQSWFESKGFATIPMDKGFLITGDSSLYRDVLGVTETLPSTISDVPVSIPAQVRGHVSSITIPKLRSIH